MAKTKQAFIEDYLKRKKLSSYEDFVKEEAAAADNALRKSLTRADTALAEAKSTYGKRAASLLSRGLSASGYGDYIDGAAYAAHAKEVSEAQKTHAGRQKESQSSYAAYLEKASAEAEAAYEEEKSTLSSAFSKLLSAKIIDEESAAAFLVGLGIDEDNARELAKKNAEVQKGTSARRNGVLSYALSHNMHYSRAYSYALANGLPESMAREIAEVAQEARDFYFEDHDY